MSNSPLQSQIFTRQIVPMLAIAVVGWAVFLLIFRSIWPAGHVAGGSLSMFWFVLAAGMVGFLGTMFAIFRAFKTPPAWRLAGAVALTAPALCLDMMATLYFDVWFPGASAADDRIYPALILGSVGALLLYCLFTTLPGYQGHAREQRNA